MIIAKTLRCRHGSLVSGAVRCLLSFKTFEFERATRRLEPFMLFYTAYALG